jgi:ATP-dependent DNA helicase PIF1
MPQIISPDVDPYNNILIANEMSYDTSKMLDKHNNIYQTLYLEQLNAYHQVVDYVSNGLGQMFFIDGFGGSDKTYLWNVLSFHFRSEGKVVLNVSSSGIASLLLPGGRTAHSQFAIPLILTEESCCNIDKESKKAELLTMASLIIWDEAPMINRLGFKAFDRC